MDGTTIIEALEQARVTIMAPSEPAIDVTVKETTRGRTWEVSIKDASTPEQVGDLLRRTVLELVRVEEAEEDQADAQT